MSVEDWPQDNLEDFIRALMPHEFEPHELMLYEELPDIMRNDYPTKESWDDEQKTLFEGLGDWNWLDHYNPLVKALEQIDLNSAKTFLLNQDEETTAFLHSSNGRKEESSGDCLDVSALLGKLVGTLSLRPKVISQAQFEENKAPRFGRKNPEAFLPDYWYELIRTDASAFVASSFFTKAYDLEETNPTWSFHRFGMTATLLPNKDWVLIAGEHEDSYDDDFWIYNDVTVFSQNGDVKHFIYPREVFPPTDFHTATLIEDKIFIIGNLGYPEDRESKPLMPVYELNTQTYAISKVQIKGPSPDRIHRHTATRDGKKIVISDGKKSTAMDITDNSGTWVLDTKSLSWTPVV